MANYNLSAVSGQQITVSLYGDGKSNFVLIPLAAFGANFVPSPAFITTVNSGLRGYAAVSNSGLYLEALLTAKPWQPGTSYSSGYVSLDVNGNIQVCTVAGTSGTSTPSWSTT